MMRLEMKWGEGGKTMKVGEGWQGMKKLFRSPKKSKLIEIQPIFKHLSLVTTLTFYIHPSQSNLYEFEKGELKT